MCHNYTIMMTIHSDDAMMLTRCDDNDESHDSDMTMSMIIMIKSHDDMSTTMNYYEVWVTSDLLFIISRIVMMTLINDQYIACIL